MGAVGAGVLVAGFMGLPAIMGSALEGCSKLLNSNDPDQASDRANLKMVGRTLQNATMCFWVPVLPGAVALVPLANRCVQMHAPASSVAQFMQRLEDGIDGLAKCSNTLALGFLAFITGGWIAGTVVVTSYGIANVTLWNKEKANALGNKVMNYIHPRGVHGQI